MSRNGSGGYTLPNNTWNPAVNGVTATAADWQSLVNDLAAAMTQSISADGQTPITGNLQLSNTKITGMAAGVNPADSANFTQVRRVGSFWNSTAITGPLVLSVSDVGIAYTINTGGSITLPVGSTLTRGDTFMIGSTIAAGVVSRQGSDLLNMLGPTVTALTLGIGDTVKLVWNGSQFVALGGTAQLRYAATFASIVTSSGIFRHPSGLIVAYGAFSASAAGDVSVTFAQSFPSSVYQVLVSPQVATTGVFAGYNTVTTTGFNGNAWVSSAGRANASVSYIAIGS